MDVGLRTFSGTIVVVFYVVRAIRSCLTFWRRSKKLPKLEEELLRTNATVLADKIRKRQVYDLPHANLLEAWNASSVFLPENCSLPLESHLSYLLRGPTISIYLAVHSLLARNRGRASLSENAHVVRGAANMDVGLRTFSGSVVALFSVVRAIRICCTFWLSPKELPKLEGDLLVMSAAVLAGKIRMRQISSLELVQAYIDRIKAVNPIINAVAEDRFEEALRDAKAVDALLSQGFDAEELKATKPLLGVPITIKENLTLKGMSSTLCSLPLAGTKAMENGAAVQKAIDAGAIPLLVSTTPEFCLSAETYTKMFGITRNPHNTFRICGGSSGGEGALLGAGASVIGMGSDLAGSIRYPSAFNGVFGHKPSPDYISVDGALPINDDPEFLQYLVVGPMVRYAEDLPLMMKVLSTNSEKLKLDEPVDMKNVKVFFMEDCGSSYGVLGVQRTIKEAIRKSAKYLTEACGATLCDQKFSMAYTHEICAAVSSKLKFANALETKEKTFSNTGELFKNLFGMSRFTQYVMVQNIVDGVTKKTPKRRVERSLKLLEELRESLTKSLGTDGVLLYPAFAETALRHKEFLIGYAGLMYSFIFNILRLPSTTVPIGKDSNGLPIGIQVIANVDQDRLCFAVARELEKGFGGWIEPGRNR